MRKNYQHTIFTVQIDEGEDEDEDDVIYKAEPVEQVVVEDEVDTDDETTERRAERDRLAEIDYAKVKVKQEPVDPGQCQFVILHRITHLLLSLILLLVFPINEATAFERYNVTICLRMLQSVIYFSDFYNATLRFVVRQGLVMGDRANTCRANKSPTLAVTVKTIE